MWQASRKELERLRTGSDSVEDLGATLKGPSAVPWAQPVDPDIFEADTVPATGDELAELFGVPETAAHVPPEPTPEEEEEALEVASSPHVATGAAKSPEAEETTSDASYSCTVDPYTLTVSDEVLEDTSFKTSAYFKFIS